MRTTTIVRAILPAALLLAAACHPAGDEASSAEATRTEALAPRTVELIQPEVRSEQPTLQLVGEVRAFDTIDVAAEVAGRVDRVRVKVGDQVKAGQPLVEIDRHTFRLRRAQAAANLAAVKAELTLTEKELERKADLLSDHTISQAAYDQAQSAHDLAAARMQAASAALDLAEHDLERSVVKAPADGVVAERHTVGGEWADVGTPLVALATAGTVKIAAEVPQGWADRLVGLKSFAFRVGAAGTERRAEVYSIDPVVQGASRSFEVVGTAPNPGDLRPGMFATVILTSPVETHSLWVPASAVAASDLPEVLLADDGRVAVAKVQTGRHLDGMVEILAGLDPGTAIIKDVAGLQRGLPVTVAGTNG